MRSIEVNGFALNPYEFAAKFESITEKLYFVFQLGSENGHNTNSLYINIHVVESEIDMARRYQWKYVASKNLLFYFENLTFSRPKRMADLSFIFLEKLNYWIKMTLSHCFHWNFPLTESVIKVDCLISRYELFHNRSPCSIETSLLICSANQWSGFYKIGTSVMKGLKTSSHFSTGISIRNHSSIHQFTQLS